MDIITWLVVGLVAGALASAVVRGSGFGLVGDIVLGIAGAADVPENARTVALATAWQTDPESPAPEPADRGGPGRS